MNRVGLVVASATLCAGMTVAAPPASARERCANVTHAHELLRGAHRFHHWYYFADDFGPDGEWYVVSYLSQHDVFKAKFCGYVVAGATAPLPPLPDVDPYYADEATEFPPVAS